MFRVLFAFSICSLILFFHFGFRESSVAVRALGALLALIAWGLAIKFDWNGRIPSFCSRRERCGFMLGAALFLIGQLFLFSVPDKVLAFAAHPWITRMGLGSVLPWMYLGTVIGLAGGGIWAAARLALIAWRQISSGILNLWKSLDGFDKGLFWGSFLLLGAGTIAVYWTTNVFFYPCVEAGGKAVWNVVYTSDSGLLTQQCAYVNLFSNENDFRQILFALCAFPLHVFHLFFYFSPLWSFWHGIGYALPQVALFAASLLLLTRLLKLHGWDKIVFGIFFMSCYPALLFVLLQEQYVVAVFFLFLYFVLCKESGAAVLLVGAGGALTTNGFGLFVAPAIPWRQRWEVLKKTLLYGVCILLITGKWGAIFLLVSKFSSYLQFTGERIGWLEKTDQYFRFLSGCFLAPAGVYSDSSLALAPYSGEIFWGGGIVMMLLLISYWLNRRVESVKLCFRWSIFSFVLLFLVGWGAPENGMILYSYYFQWAFCALLWSGASVLLKKIPWGNRVFFLIVSMVLFLFNLPAIWRLWQWGVAQYPAL